MNLNWQNITAEYIVDLFHKHKLTPKPGILYGAGPDLQQYACAIGAIFVDADLHGYFSGTIVGECERHFQFPVFFTCGIMDGFDEGRITNVTHHITSEYTLGYDLGVAVWQMLNQVDPSVYTETRELVGVS